MAGFRSHTVKRWLLCGALLTVPGSLLPQPHPQTITTLTEPPAPLLPSNDRLIPDNAPTSIPVEKPEEITVLKECGLKRQDSRTILSGPGGPSNPAGSIRAYQFVDATGALSAYTYFRQGGRARLAPQGLAETELPGGETVLLDGVSVVIVRQKQDRALTDALLTTIEVGLPKIDGRRGLPPLLPTLFPRPGLAGESLRYALGPVSYRVMGGLLPSGMLAWDKSAEAATARYKDEDESGTLTLLMYPTPEIAGDRGKAIQDLIGRGGTDDLRAARLRRIGPLLALASGGFSARRAETLLQSVHLNQEVTLDKAMPSEFHVEIRKTVTLLEQIAAFVGVGILAALVLGVFFGGGRAAIRVMQGKPAWVDPEFLHIDLRGRPEPLKPTRD